MAVNDKNYIPPFQMYGNIYFVGSRKVSVHIIKTQVGLVMIDTGYPSMYEQILENMKALDLDPKDICAIFHSHGHIDHFGCTLRFKALSGAKTYISRIDNDIVNGKYDLSWTKELNLPDFEKFDCDCLIEDGDCFTFGSTVIRCRLTPGHTDGTLSFFINAEDGESTITAAMLGGVGMNTMKANFLNAYGLSFSCRDAFRNSLHALREETVNLVLGNHPGQNNTEGKLKKVREGRKLGDNGEAWQYFLRDRERLLDKLIQEEKEQQ